MPHRYSLDNKKDDSVDVPVTVCHVRQGLTISKILQTGKEVKRVFINWEDPLYLSIVILPFTGDVCSPYNLENYQNRVEWKFRFVFVAAQT